MSTYPELDQFNNAVRLLLPLAFIALGLALLIASSPTLVSSTTRSNMLQRFRQHPLAPAAALLVVLVLVVVLAGCGGGSKSTTTTTVKSTTTTTIDPIVAKDISFVKNVRAALPELTATQADVDITTLGSTICSGAAALGGLPQLMAAVHDLAAVNDPRLLGASENDVKVVLVIAVPTYCPEYTDSLSQL